MTEWVDVSTLLGKSFELPVLGTLEVADGKINAKPLEFTTLEHL